MPPHLFDRALRFLASKERSRAQIKAHLQPYGTPEEVLQTLDRLVELGLQSDERHAQSHVCGHKDRHGRRRLEYDLSQAGLDPDLIQHILDTCLDEEETVRAQSVLARKFGMQRPEGPAWARQARFLQGRGFDSDVVLTVLREALKAGPKAEMEPDA
jgi:regulatory protein